MLYEINYLILQSKTSDLDQIREETKKLVESHEGKITAEKIYLKRKLAYEIKRENYGFYTVLRFTLDEGERLAELRRDLDLNQNISRYIMVRAEELPSLEIDNNKETIASSREKATIKQEDVEKIIAEAETEEKVEKKTVQKNSIEDAKEEVKIEEKNEDKSSSSEDEGEKVEEKKEKKEDKRNQDKASLDELDKKLDEILNI